MVERSGIDRRLSTFGAGLLVGGRYRLVALVSAAERSETWRADDEVLARPVAVRLLTKTEEPALSAAVLSAAAAAGRYAGPGVARVLDAATEPAPRDVGGELTYVVSSWVAGETLADRLRTGGVLDVPAAVALVTAICSTLEAMHRSGVFMTGLHPGRVILTAEGEAVLLDAHTAAAAAAPTAPTAPPAPPAPTGDPATLVRRDTGDAARILFAALTSTWPEPEGGGGTDYHELAATPRHDGRLCLPRQVKAGLPRSLDLVVALTLDPRRRPQEPAIVTPRQLRLALSRAEPVSQAPPAEVAPPRPGRRRLRRRWLLIPLVLLLAGIGAAGWVLGLVVGRVPTVPGAKSGTKVIPGLHADSSPGAPTSAAPLTLGKVTSFDPQADGAENETDVPSATDGDDSTAWATEQYYTVNFGGLKHGVGLLVDLGRPTKVARVVVTAPAGETLEILSGGSSAQPPSTVSDSTTPVVAPAATTAADKDTTLTLSSTTASRWYVVWITGLRPVPGAGRAFDAEINEMAFYG